MRMYELHLEPSEVAHDGNSEFSRATCDAWRELLHQHGVADHAYDAEGYAIKFGPLWNRSYLFDLADVMSRTATADAYITAYASLRPEMLQIIGDATRAANAVLSRAPRSVGENIGPRASFCDTDHHIGIVTLKTHDDLRRWLDESVGRDVMSFPGSKLVLGLFWVFGALFTRDD